MKPHWGWRLAWVIPNVCLYLLFLGLSVFVLGHSNELQEINRLGLWLIALLALLGIALIGTYRIMSWIKQGKL